MTLEELSNKVDKLEEDLKESNKIIKNLVKYRDKVIDDNDPFNGYF